MLHKHSLCIFALLSSTLSSQTLAENAPCTVHHCDDYYDLSPLQSSKDYEFKSPGGYDFVVNVCKPVNNDTWAIKVDNPGDVGGFSRHERGDFSIGNANTTLTVRDGHPLLVMTDGSRCPQADSMTASTAIRFICDTSVYGAGNPTFVAQLPPEDDLACAFFLEWRTHIACPTHEKTGSIGFLTVLAAILATALMLYILVGTFYNRYVLELRGFDQIPRLHIFSFKDSIAVMRSCVDRVRNRAPDSWSTDTWSRGGRDYRGLGDEEEPMMHGPPGFLDEQDEEEPRAGAPTDETPRPAGEDSDGIIRL